MKNSRDGIKTVNTIRARGGPTAPPPSVFFTLISVVWDLEKFNDFLNNIKTNLVKKFCQKKFCGHKALAKKGQKGLIAF